MNSSQLDESFTRPIPKDKPRVLIVENNETSRNMYRDLLIHWGYFPVVAQGTGQTLLKDARQKAEQYRCHLALVDMRLLDDVDDEDKSGLALISQLRPAVSILMSGYGNLADSRRATEEGAAGFIGKSEGPRVFKEKLEREACKLCAAKNGLVIEPVELMDNLRKNLLLHSAAYFDDQIADCLLRLFPQARYLRLEKIGTTHIASDLSAVPRPRSVILKVYEDDRQPVIVKLARQTKITHELENFHQFIDGKLRGNYVPVLRGYVLGWDIGGIKLSYVGDIGQNFSNFFQSHSTHKIKRSLSNFFEETWQPHYRRAVEANNLSLFELYCRTWDKEWVERIKNFTDSHPEEIMGTELWAQVQAPEPIEWMKHNIFGQRDVSMTEHTKLAITHGDLHGDNILTDEDGNLWVIDFERTGQGHILQDFIELESDIINRLPCTPESFPAFLSICITACLPREIKNLELTEEIGAQSETKKAMSIISHLRSLARSITGIRDARQYLLGLLFNTLFRATLSTSTSRKPCQQRAFMLASILCHRLDHWDDAWPPAHWLPFLQ
ncbi:MAG: hypothetical protein DDG60_16100 [Anaerolineae bacterium]|nr:MAG: hypothetical protein DDG60_16100 [Anaerolineae bacterium]